MKKQQALLPVDEITKRISLLFSRDLDQMPVKQLYAGGYSFDIKENAEKSFTKKYLWAEISVKDLDTLARSNFIDDCLRLESLWGEFPFADPVSERYIKTIRSITEAVLGDLDEESWFSECRNSSGATIGAGFQDSSWEKKFSYPITGTVDQIRLFERYLLWDPQLEAAIFELNRLSTSPRYRAVRGSRFHTVPKDSTKNRTIAVETTLGMFFQQGLMTLMARRLNKWGLCLDALPERHKDYAFHSSITLQNATLDVKSASDSVHVKCVSVCCPPRWVAALNLVRCKEIEVRKGLWMELPMISTMGNATTFPLETLLFYALSVTAVAEHRRFKERNMNYRPSLGSFLPTDDELHSVSVFGDDIILPTDCAQKAMSIMAEFGFRINRDKSFFDSYPFRESCGGDYFAGYDVRPFFLERPTSNSPNAIVSWLYHIWNSLSEKYISYFGENWVYVCQDTFNFLAEVISDYGVLRIVPDNMPTTSGIIDPDPRLLLGLSSRVRFLPLIVDSHGTCLFSYLSFDYIKRVKYPSSLYLHLYRALRAPAEIPRYVKRKKLGKWSESLSFGSLALMPTPAIADLVGFVKTDREYPIREHVSGSYQTKLKEFLHEVANL